MDGPVTVAFLSPFCQIGHGDFFDHKAGASRWPDVDRESLARQRFGMAGTEPSGTVVDIAHLDRLVVRLAPPMPSGGRLPCGMIGGLRL